MKTKKATSKRASKRGSRRSATRDAKAEIQDPNRELMDIGCVTEQTQRLDGILLANSKCKKSSLCCTH